MYQNSFHNRFVYNYESCDLKNSTWISKIKSITIFKGTPNSPPFMELVGSLQISQKLITVSYRQYVTTLHTK